MFSFRKLAIINNLDNFRQIGGDHDISVVDDKCCHFEYYLQSMIQVTLGKLTVAMIFLLLKISVFISKLCIIDDPGNVRQIVGDNYISIIGDPGNVILDSSL